MPVPGRKPKPESQRRNHHPLGHDWVDVPDVPFDGPAPPDPPADLNRGPVPEIPERRPLGSIGRLLWEENWWTASSPAERELLYLTCEQHDDRLRIRTYALMHPEDWRAQVALRQLDAQVAQNLQRLAFDGSRAVAAAAWPPDTVQWWRSIASMPHCVLWTEADWQYARDTMRIAAAFHLGNTRLAQELRLRERVMGTTADARRDLRVRYVDPADMPGDGDGPVGSVASLDDRRRRLTGG